MESIQLLVLMTSHNRCSLTVECIQRLKAAQRKSTITQMHIVLADASSSDGTAQTVSVQFPEVRICDVSSNTYWNRGMIAARCAASDLHYSHVLLLNDDTHLDPDALSNFVVEATRSHHARYLTTFVGATTSGSNDAPTYGGQKSKSKWRRLQLQFLPLADYVQKADTFTGNIVFLPAAVIAMAGFLDPKYSHRMGDTDLGFRISKAQLPIFQLPGRLGYCNRNSMIGTWKDPSLSLGSRCRLLQSPKGLPLQEWARFCRSHGGPLFLVPFTAPYVRILEDTVKTALIGIQSLAQSINR